MANYLKKIWKILKGFRFIYVLYFFLQFITIFLMVTTTYTSKILLDVLTPGEAELGHLGNLIVSIYGGKEYLRENLWLFAIILLSLAIIAGVNTMVRVIIREKVKFGISKKVQLELFYHIERLPYSFIKKCQSGDIIQTCTRDEAVLRRFIAGQVPQLLYTFGIFITCTSVLFDLSWKLALVSMVFLPCLFVYGFFYSKKIGKLYRKADDSEGQVTAKIEENLNSVRIVKAYNNEKFEIDQFDSFLLDYKAKYSKWKLASCFFAGSSDIFVFGQILLTMLFGAYLVIHQEISTGTFILATSFSTMIVWPLRFAARILGEAARAFVAIDRMEVILNEPLEDIETGEKPDIKGNIKLDNVCFKYDDGDEEVLNGISAEIKAGETVAIMGKTGSGKSTLSHLLTRLFDYNSGSIKLDGVELNSISKKWLRQHISCVLQEPFLFSKTIINNIKIGFPELSDETVYDAAKIAAIDDNIRSFKQGYDTPVGENGITLSGGQKQRVAIARSLVKNAPILIFDDSLSAVDTDTDIKIRNALKTRTNKATTLIVTHRISTALDADKIIVLDQGKISQMGTHKQLLKQDGLYKELYEIQTRMK